MLIALPLLFLLRERELARKGRQRAKERSVLRRSASLAQVLALTKCGDAGAAWGGCDDAIPAAQSAMKSVPFCVDALFVAAPLTAIGGFPIRPSTGDALRELSERTKRHYGIAPRVGRVGDSNASTQVVTLFTRNDAGTRRLSYAPEMISAMRVTRVVESLVLSLAEQIRLFDEADVFVAPHGNNNVNSLWMRPGSLYVEVRPSCAEMCVLGCDKRFAHAPVATNVTFLDLFDAPLDVACGVAGNPFGAALHQRTGVRFHVVSACVGGNRCMQRGAGPAKFYLPGGRVDDSHRSWKYNWNPQVIQVTTEVAAAVRAAIDGPDDADAHARAMPASATSVRATPFAVTCGPAVASRAFLPSPPAAAPADAVSPSPPRPPATPAPASAIARGNFELYAPKSALKVNAQFAGEGLYALGDIVRINDGGQRSRATKHAGTIGDYYVRHVPASGVPNASVLAAAVDAVCPTLVPANESSLAEVVLHIRVGDVLCVRPKNPGLHVQRQPPPVAEVARVVREVAGTCVEINLLSGCTPKPFKNLHLSQYATVFGYLFGRYLLDRGRAGEVKSITYRTDRKIDFHTGGDRAIAHHLWLPLQSLRGRVLRVSPRARHCDGRDARSRGASRRPFLSRRRRGALHPGQGRLQSAHPRRPGRETEAFCFCSCPGRLWGILLVLIDTLTSKVEVIIPVAAKTRNLMRK